MCFPMNVDLATDAHVQRSRSLEHRLALRASARRPGRVAARREATPVH